MVGMVVNFHAVDMASVFAFLFHKDDIVVDVLVKHTFLNVEGQFLSLHIGEQSAPFEGGYGDETVGDKECQYAESQCKSQ